MLLQDEMFQGTERGDIPFFFVHTRMPASLDAKAAEDVAARERHAADCKYHAVRNKTISDFPALLNCLSLPAKKAVKDKLIFHIMSREIVSQSLDQALEGFEPTAKSNLLQSLAPFFFGPCVAGFITLFTMTIANQACEKLGLIAESGDEVELERVKDDFVEIGEKGVRGFSYSILRGYFSMIPLVLFNELFYLVTTIGSETVMAGIGSFFGAHVVTSCINNLLESRRWGPIAAVIRKHAFRIHMQWVILNGNVLWRDF